MDPSQQPCSYAWLGPKGCGKRTRLLDFLKTQANKVHLPFDMKKGTWYLTKQTTSADPDDDDDEATGKSIPYEESALHLGFNIAHMSMSDKVFLQSILSRWTGQQDVCLMGSTIHMRYLVLYHAHFLTDESVLQLQECLEQYSHFAILLTTELPLSSRLRDFCFEIPLGGEDHLLAGYTKRANLQETDVWLRFFQKTLEDWSCSWSTQKVAEIRNWIYICLQRNLRWTDVMGYWLEAIYQTKWITPKMKAELLHTLWNAESSAGYILITSYRIPILWEHVHLKLARQLYQFRKDSPPPLTDASNTTQEDTSSLRKSEWEETVPTTSFPITSFSNTSFPITSFPNTSFPNTSFPNTSFPNTSFPNTSFPKHVSLEA